MRRSFRPVARPGIRGGLGKVPNPRGGGKDTAEIDQTAGKARQKTNRVRKNAKII